MRVLILILLIVSTGCSSVRVRDKWTDPTHRLFISPDGISEENYVAIQASLTEANRFFIVDRSAGFNAIRKEQQMIHQDDTEAFNDADKYSRLGALYSVGAVVVARIKCVNVHGVFGYFNQCKQYLSAIDSSTGLVIASVAGESEGSEMDGTPPWDNTVDKFCRAFPTSWEPFQYDKGMQDFRAANVEHAIRQKEKLANEQLRRSPAGAK